MNATQFWILASVFIPQNEGPSAEVRRIKLLQIKGSLCLLGRQSVLSRKQEAAEALRASARVGFGIGLELKGVHISLEGVNGGNWKSSHRDRAADRDSDTDTEGGRERAFQLRVEV